MNGRDGQRTKQRGQGEKGNFDTGRLNIVLKVLHPFSPVPRESKSGILSLGLCFFTSRSLAFLTFLAFLAFLVRLTFIFSLFGATTDGADAG